MTAPVCATVDARGRLHPGSSTAVVPWWSFTKTLIAACALRLVEDGRLALDAPLAAGPYTLRHLLQHRAGTGAAGQLRPLRHQHTELGGDDIEPLGGVGADLHQRAMAARAGVARRPQHPLDARQVPGRTGLRTPPTSAAPRHLLQAASGTSRPPTAC